MTLRAVSEAELERQRAFIEADDEQLGLEPINYLGVQQEGAVASTYGSG